MFLSDDRLTHIQITWTKSDKKYLMASLKDFFLFLIKEPDFQLHDFLQGGTLLFLFVAGIYGSPETIGLILFQMLSHSHSRRNTAKAAQKYTSLKEENTPLFVYDFDITWFYFASFCR